MLIWILLYIFKNFCGEDEYQKSRMTNTPPYIYGEIVYKYCNDLSQSIRNTYNEYFTVKPITFENSVHISNSSNHLKKLSLEIYTSVENEKSSENTIKKHILYLDHRYFSGLFFMLLGKNLYNLKPLNIMKEIYIPFVTEWYIIKFLFYMLFYINDDKLEFVEKKEDIRRERFFFDVDEINMNGKRKYKVFYHILSYIYSKININRKMKVLIPVAFEASKERYNNVGCIFIYFDGNFNNMVEQLENNKYHAIATNTLQRFMNSGKKARSFVDVVLSCGCFEGGSDNIQDFYITYENIADYPIYCLSTTFDSKVKSTITWMNKL